jgi:MFS family permease
MIITRKKKVPMHWAFYAQLPLLFSIWGGFVVNAPFLLLMKRYIDNPAAIMGLISVQVYVTLFSGPIVSWLSDRIWTRYGRRKFFLAAADIGGALFLVMMPFAPNLITLIVLRWSYDTVRSFGQPTQALAYEVVPAPQRGRSAGFLSASIQLGNLVFFFLLLGRFHDSYFMGPFALFSEASGGIIMFLLCAILLVGIGLFELLGFKEIRPPDRKRINDDRAPGQGIISHFFKAFVRDVFGKDLLPLYLLLFMNVMFGVSLGLFQPLLFTEQWGYSLQDMGNTVAVGVIFAVILSLLSGWVADKIGKMRAYVIALAGSFIINIAYTVYVYNLPDYRPTLLQIILFGNIGLVFGMLKGIVAFPLMMEYVKRSRMGSASAGIGLFNSVVSNTMGLVVGLWLAWWSIWFLPQAGYNITPTFKDELAEQQVRAQLAAAGVDTGLLKLRPLHQPGVDGETSTRWWIHVEDQSAHQLLAERKKVQDRLGRTERKLESPLLRDGQIAATQALRDQLAEMRAAINARLDARTQEIYDQLTPALRAQLFPAGDQILAAGVGGSTLTLSLATIEPLREADLRELERVLVGPELALDDGNRARIEALPLSDGRPGFTVVFHLDDRFLTVFAAAAASGLPDHQAASVANTVLSLGRGVAGRANGSFNLCSVEFKPLHDGQFAMELCVEVPNPRTGQTMAILGDALRGETQFTDGIVRLIGTRLEFEAVLPPQPDRNGHSASLTSEIRGRIAQLVGDQLQVTGLLALKYAKAVDAAAARPIYVTVPRHAVDASYSEREYEYFFSSQTLILLTDVIGFLIILLIVYFEKRGTIHRSGAEEDLNR